MQKRAEPSTGGGPRRRRYDASGRQEEAARRRARVVDEAERLFLSQGYGATSIAEIARMAEVSAQTVYGVFGSKAGVLARIMDVRVAGDDEDAGLARERADFATVMAPGLPAVERIRGAAHAARSVNERSGHVWRLVDSVAGADAAVAELLDGWLERMRQDCAAGAAMFDLQELRPGLSVDDVTDVLFLLGGTRTYCTLVLDLGRTPDDYEAWLESALRRQLLPGD